MISPETAAAEFDCSECGRHIVSFVGPLSDRDICLHCLALPGWHEQEALRDMLDPDFATRVAGRGWRP